MWEYKTYIQVYISFKKQISFLTLRRLVTPSTSLKPSNSDFKKILIKKKHNKTTKKAHFEKKTFSTVALT